MPEGLRRTPTLTLSCFQVPPSKSVDCSLLSVVGVAWAMEAAKLRVRVIFEDRGILSKSQLKNGLKRSWVLLKPQLHTFSDVVSYLFQSFDLHHSCPNGIILSMDGFVLPPFESTTILKDKDLIRVKRKGTILHDATKAIDKARPFIEDEIVEKQPLPSASGVKLLANEELDEEIGGYQSEPDEDEEEAEEPVENAHRGDVASKKRKASRKIESPKKKRQRQIAPESAQKKNVINNQEIGMTQKKRKHTSGSKQDALSIAEVTPKCSKIPEPTSNELKEKKEKTMQASGIPDGAKKVSRSTRRKQIKRLLKRQDRANAKRDEGRCEMQLVAKDLNTDSGYKKEEVTDIVQQADEDNEAEDDLIPVEIRPGHIRFTPSGKAKAIQQNQEENVWDVPSSQKSAWKGRSWDVKKNEIAKETFFWNGITSKRKGQKWGKENQPTSFWKESRDYNNHSSNARAARNQPTSSWKKPRDYNGHSSSTSDARNGSVDFEKLVPLTDSPKAGDIIAYRLLELSSAWCPELSSFRIGKITWFELESNRIILVPVPEYPLNLEKKEDNDQDDDASEQPPQPSFYNEDGSLEIDFPSLVDVRIVKRGDVSQSKGTEAPAANGNPSPSRASKEGDETQDKSKNVASEIGNKELCTPPPVNGKKDVWEEITEALSAKKAQLMQEDSWKKKESSAKRSWSHRNLRSGGLGPTMAMLRAQNGC